MHTKKVILITTVSVGMSILIFCVGMAAVYASYLQQNEFRIFSGVTVAGIDLSSKTYLEALDILEERSALVAVNGITVTVNAPQGDEDVEALEPLVLPSMLIPSEASGNEIELYNLDIKRALDAAYALGRSNDMLTNAKEQLLAYYYGREFSPDYRFNREQVGSLIEEQFSSLEEPARNATIRIDGAGMVDVVKEEVGMVFDMELILNRLEEKVRAIDDTPLTIALQNDIPSVTTVHILEHVAAVEEALRHTPLTLTADDTEWEMDRVAVGGWLTFTDESWSVDPVLLEESSAFMEIAEEVEVDATEARWRVLKDEYGVLTGFEPLTEPRTGKSIDVEVTAQRISEWLQQPDSESVVALAITERAPHVTQETIESFGIKNLLGTGHSNMSGSPTNRRGNIARGVELLDGLLLPPNEPFSLVDALKPFTLENGYVAELVIKGNETVPEVGGGLCQIGTTTFRGAMNAGLDIIERRNHSYAVSYYSDDRNHLPGTDATIYDPQPNLVFENDTPGYILLQTRIDGNDLYFDYWGVSDGRKAEFTPPVVYSWIDPPPLKEVETDTLAPGERKCTESAHRGVTAEFTYRVDYADGEHHEEVFTSVYKPWQAVCLVGKSEPAPEVSTPLVPASTNEETTAEQDDEEKNTKPKKKSEKQNESEITNNT